MKIKMKKRLFLLVTAAAVGLLLGAAVYRLRGEHSGRGLAGKMGLNTELPKARFDPRKAFMDKMKLYDQADRDSARREQFVERKPVMVSRPVVETDKRADELLRQLDKLRETVHQPAEPASGPPAWSPPPVVRSVRPARDTVTGDVAKDARVDQLNVLLDKVIRIQHPNETGPAPVLARLTDEVAPADSFANTIVAVVAQDQTLTAGATIELRILDSIRVDGRVLPAGQLVFGTVSIASDRMVVHITALREDRNIYTADLQVYDLDGLAGIHIPGMLSREVAKQSADQGVSSLNVLNMDPSLEAQAAAAGIQTVKSFVGHKVRQVRVSVKAGYQVLLRPARLKSLEHSSKNGGLVVESVNRPPGIVPDGPILKRCRIEGMELSLRGIWLEDSCLWFGLEWVNRSPIEYVPGYARWFIRDRRVFRRTAVQELPVTPLSQSALTAVGDDSMRHSWIGFQPFAIAKDKELVLEVGEKGGGRVLQLVIDHHELLHAKKYGKETEP